MIYHDFQFAGNNLNYRPITHNIWNYSEPFSNFSAILKQEIEYQVCMFLQCSLVQGPSRHCLGFPRNYMIALHCKCFDTWSVNIRKVR
jgi:hypothetical protein